MRFRRKIDDHIRMFLFKELVHSLTVTDIGLDKTEIRQRHHRCQSRQIPGIRQLIQTNHPKIRMRLQHMKNKIRTDKTGTAGDD